MILDEIRKTVYESRPEQWSVVEERLARPDLQQEAVYRSDLRIGLARGERAHEKDLSEMWHDCFPDATASSHYVEIRYCGTPVERLIYVAVDGNRACLPFPTVEKVAEREYRYSTTEEECRLPRLLDALYFGGRFDDYLARSEILVES